MNKKELEVKVRNLLKSGAGTKFEVSSDGYEILNNLIKSHPEYLEKIGCGVKYFFIQKSKWKYNQCNFMIKRIDDSEIDFSFVTCLSGIGKSHWNHIFRDIIKQQIDDFRSEALKVIGDKNKFICSHTNLKFKTIFSHVDHVYPITFESILNEFITSRKLDLEKIPLSEDLGNSEVMKITDENIKSDFYNFHQERAVLRLVVSTANLQAKRTKNYNNESPSVIKEELIKKYPQYHIK